MFQGYASGSFGPTTAGRMDSYVERFQREGGSMVMLAKGNRSKMVRTCARACVIRSIHRRAAAACGLKMLMLCVWLWQVTAACKKHGGFYLGSIGGPAAILAQNCIKKVEVLEFPELG